MIDVYTVSNIMGYDKRRRNRWYFGGFAASSAAAITHPLDLIKVHLQTQQTEGHSLFTLVGQLYKNQGILGFYSGLSAAIFRQMTYTMARFAIYEGGKPYINEQEFWPKIGLATVAGIIGGVIGCPGDIVNVRMQNDVKLPKDQRRNYKHIFDGLARIIKEEGPKSLFAGNTLILIRSVLVTISANAMYDQTKSWLLLLPIFDDGPSLHFTSSLLVGGLATMVSQPVDVIKTRWMNAKPGEYASIQQLIWYTAKLGPSGFFKGFTPSFVRLGPQTILTFMFLEQFRLYFGYIPETKSE